jgi:hypothetical protein
MSPLPPPPLHTTNNYIISTQRFSEYAKPGERPILGHGFSFGKPFVKESERGKHEQMWHDLKLGSYITDRAEICAKFDKLREEHQRAAAANILQVNDPLLLFLKRKILNTL